jgi:predicted DNA-binding WGR domain protein
MPQPKHRTRRRDLYVRWEQGSRYYIVHLHEDLWGALCVTRAWGARGAPQGQVRHQTCASRAEAAAVLWRLRRQRNARGYRRRFNSPLP